MSRVLVCGLATVDIVQTVEHLPSPNEKVVALTTRIDAGGPALNAALTAAHLGSDVTLVTAVGTGGLSPVITTTLADHGVHLIDRAPAGFMPPLSTVLITRATGERAVISRNALGTTGYRATPTVDDALRGCDAVLVDGHHLPLGLEVATAARAHGIPVILDGGSWKPGLEALLALTDLAVVSADFTAPKGPQLDDLLALGPRWVARSHGGDPLSWRSADGSCGSVTPPPVTVVDTLGAGDVLHGGFVHHLASGERPDVALMSAVMLASISTTHPGRLRSHPSPTARTVPYEGD